MDKYVAKFIDTEGNIYCLVNGWNKQRTFFKRTIEECCLFDDLRTIKTSIKKLLKISKISQLGYESDKIKIDRLVFKIIDDKFRVLDHIVNNFIDYNDLVAYQSN